MTDLVLGGFQSLKIVHILFFPTTMLVLSLYYKRCHHSHYSFLRRTTRRNACSLNNFLCTFSPRIVCEKEQETEHNDEIPRPYSTRFEHRRRLNVLRRSSLRIAADFSPFVGVDLWQLTRNDSSAKRD
jgi:hypothetical protein